MSNGVSGSLYSLQAQQKLVQLRKSIMCDVDGVESDIGKKNEATLELSDMLFKRAPEDFLGYRSVSTLEAIAEQAAEVFDSFIKSSENQDVVRINTQNFPDDNERANVTSFVIAMGDRPFVIDTISKVFATHNIQPRVLLHPIMRCNEEQLVSLVYLEVDSVSDTAALEELRLKLQAALDDLLVVTNDFAAMLVRAENIRRAIESDKATLDESQEGPNEIREFLRWLVDGGFVFLGHRQWQVQKNNSSADLVDQTFDIVPKADLGLFRSTNPDTQVGLHDLNSNVAQLLKQKSVISFAKTVIESPISSRTRLDLLLFRTTSEDGSKVLIHGFFGTLTSKSISQEASSIPLIRRKLEQIIAIEGMLPNSHDYKEVVSIVDSIPKSELLHFDVETIRRNINMIMSIPPRGETKISVEIDPLNRAVYLIVVLPHERFGREVHLRIQDYIERSLGLESKSSEYRLAVTEKLLARIHFFIPNPSLSEIDIDIPTWQQDITELTLTWNDRLLHTLSQTNDETLARQLGAFYNRILPDEYKAATLPKEAVFDISILHSLNDKNPLELALRQPTNNYSAKTFDLKVYKYGGGLTLSSTVPYLENAGLMIHHEATTVISKNKCVEAEIYNFRVKARSGDLTDEKVVRECFVPGLREVISERVENDKLNMLLLNPGLSWSEIAVLRTMQRYLRQIRSFATTKSIVGALVDNPSLAKLLVTYFHAKFDPSAGFADMSERKTKLNELNAIFHNGLKKVSILIYDRILRALLNVLEATVRTNYYNSERDSKLALKIECKRIEQMPDPRPLYEVFVSAPDFEGVHLRGGKVARGGIRWSERPDDYRTEVLGLMKTQMAKNSIIIPVGAKGGFIAKRVPSNPAVVRNSYRRFIQALLQITDNRAEGEVIPCTNSIIYDEPDPYFVVAADKGTAAFSDIANEIAVKEFGFWLGDAFASGGSYGYDHKKLAITARGTWEAVCQHFKEIGVDPYTQQFTVVGIGDMSGDVFGNGLLLSKSAKLLAAFDHKHIFVDPNPVPEISYKERQRLFDLPKSSWKDYREDLLSAGGAIYSRDEKEITLSPEAQKALGTSESVMPGHDLVKAILKAPVDLLWNGGIGTYVKARAEDNLSAGDRTNDACRVNACDVRAKIIGEGGNLGLTQLARVEYSKIGGHINVDAIDNSGGVDCSDLEVNLKILLQIPIRRGELTFEQRNVLLMSLSDEVCDKVISRNRSQSEILGLEVYHSRRHLDRYQGLINDFEHRGILVREAEFLPDNEELAQRNRTKSGLTRPELSILIAYTKMSLCDAILNSHLPEDPFLRSFLMSYFPREVVNRFSSDMPSHPLAREIVATQVSNSLVERMGATFVHRMGQETGAQEIDIISSYLSAERIVGVPEFLAELREMNKSCKNARAFRRAMFSLTYTLDGMTRWFLDRKNEQLTWVEHVQRYQGPFRVLLNNTSSFLTKSEKTRFNDSVNQLVVDGFSKKLAELVTSVSYAVPYLDIIDIASTKVVDHHSVATLYAAVVSEFYVPKLLEASTKIESTDKWEAIALRTIMSQLRKSIGAIAKSIIDETGEVSEKALRKYIDKRAARMKSYLRNMDDLQTRQMTLPSLMVITNQLSSFSNNED